MSPPRLRTLAPLLTVLDGRTNKSPDHTAAPIYKTDDYAKWREVVIARAGGKCQWPGCERAERRMFADHIRELKDGGAPFDPANGQCLCGRHHTLKTVQARADRQNFR